jgi:hypothetical protein
MQKFEWLNRKNLLVDSFSPISGKDVKDDCLAEKIINDVKIKKSIKYM